MERRNFITALIALPALGLLAACGSDSGGDSLSSSDTNPAATSGSTATPDSLPDTTSNVAIASSAVLSYTTPGGFTMRGVAFQNAPRILITDAGTLITLAPVPEIYPGPLLPQHSEQTISPAGVEAILAAAESAGLLADVDYTAEENVTDASTATLTITVDGTTYVHEAYGLGVEGGPGAGSTESTPERQALLDFLTSLVDDPAAVAGAENLGAPEAYEPTAYQFSAAPVEDLSGFEPEPTIQLWPTDTDIELATSIDCVEIDRDLIGDVFEQATELTFFAENDVTYQVTPRPAYPGRTC